MSMTKITEKPTFVIKIIDTQNQTWQGTVTWLNGKYTKPFRSLLELIKLLDSAIENPGDEKEEPPHSAAH